ncbi:MAG: O-antigen ligase family protein [Polaromonas sp.]|jgi:exopolysaccharide production protein ExoQ|nr:O-antigen ligase family protein [Polaromonas sp.]
MSNRISHWLVGNPAQPLSIQESGAAIALLLIFAFSLNILPPNFSFTGMAEVTGDGSLFNQAFWIGIFILSLWTLVNSKRTLSGVFFMALPLLMMCMYLLVSSLWSLAPAISFRRSILELIVIVSILAIISALQTPSQVFIILYRVAAITLMFESVMLLRTNGFDEAGFFRGIHTQKNVLGLVGAVAVLTGIWVRTSGVLIKTHWNAIYLLGWLSLLVLSQSKTSLALILLAPAIGLGLRKLARSFGVGVGAPLLVLCAIAYSVFAVAFIAGVDVGRAISDWVHQVGFTGRDNIWDFLIARFLERPWIGHGYGGFWDIGLDAPNVRYGIGFITQINQAHNGYLDLLLAVGVAGLVAYVGVVIGFIHCLSVAEHQSQNRTLALCWVFFIFSLLHNITESTLLRGYSPVWVMQLIAMAITYRMAHEAKGSR